MAAGIGAGAPVVGGLRLDGGRHRAVAHRGRHHLARRHGYAGSVRVGRRQVDEAIINYIRRTTAC